VETQTSLSTERKKPGPQAKPKVDVEALLTRVHNLEELITRMAHQSGTAHVLIKNAGLEPYQPTKGDMSKFKVVT
jgi:hypothetical protein